MKLIIEYQTGRPRPFAILLFYSRSFTLSTCSSLPDVFNRLAYAFSAFVYLGGIPGLKNFKGTDYRKQKGQETIFIMDLAKLQKMQQSVRIGMTFLSFLLARCFAVS